MRFEPIAVVGQSCVLPGALSPRSFWENIASGRVSLCPAPEGRWRVPRSQVIGTPEDPADHMWNDVGGYVHGFEDVFDPAGFRIAPERIAGLDPVFRWVLHGTREALRDSGHDGPVGTAGLVLGNLSFPSAAMARFAEHVWLADQPADVRRTWDDGGGRPDARNRFSSGLPAHLAAHALGLGAGAFALDAACASSLYAVKLACDRLHDGTADLMLAGAVNCVDDLFLRLAFCSLSAMSPTGRSRPFHRAADGLVPAEGAAFVALMRLRDAAAQGRPVLGVIRGIGLSNDGREGGFLAPAEDGQVRAMRQAYAAAGIDPRTVSLVECHATGTQLGDAVELRALSRVLEGGDGVPVGSVKANIGHPVTAAGMAGLLKVLGAMQAGVLPTTVGVDEPSSALDGTPLRLPRENEPWDGQRRAAVSSFGFGGNNAHLVIDAWDGARVGGRTLPRPRPATAQPASDDPVVIVGVGARVGDGADTTDLTRALLDGARPTGPRESVEVGLDGLRFPPRDLERALPQQVLVLEAAREAVEGITLPPERTTVLMGMGCDPELARYHARVRAGARAGDGDAFTPPLDAPGALGGLANIVANRLNVQLGVSGPGYSVSAEEASGLVALEVAVRALATGEADAAVVGAVDLSHEPVHRAALAELGVDRVPGDAAVVLVLKRRSAALRDGDPVIAELDAGTSEPADMVVGDAGERGGRPGFDPAALFGTAHAATGLVAVACAALALHHRAVPDDSGGPAAPSLGVRSADVVVSPLDAPRAGVRLRAGGSGPAAWLSEPPPSLHRDPGRDRRPMSGEVAFVYTNGATAYPGVCRELMLAFPAITDRLEREGWPLERLLGWAHRGGDGGRPQRPNVFEQVWGVSLLARFHTEITRGVLGIEPAAVLGYSSGEISALAAMGVWADIPSLIDRLTGADVFVNGVVGRFDAVRRAWAKRGIPGERWASYLVMLPADTVRQVLAGNRAVHLQTINAPEVCVVGGEATACARVIGELGPDRAVRIDYEIAVHAPELEDVQAEWWQAYHHPANAAPAARFYNGSTGGWYHPTAESAADAATALATNTSDFVRTVERAYADGVRVFIEHGPRGLCTGWIGSILGEREHLAVSLDGSGGRDVRQLVRSVAELAAAGVEMDTDALIDHLGSSTPPARRTGNRLTLPAHPPAVRLTAAAAARPPAPMTEVPVEQMAPAPPLPLVPVPQVAPVTGPVAQVPAMAVAVGVDPDLIRAATVAHERGLTEALHGYLTEQARVHRRILEMRPRTEAALRLLPGPAPLPPAPEPTPPRPVAAPEPERPTAVLPGPKFDRAQLEHLAGGRISDVFGPLFAAQDARPRQTRMPMPPLLLADRVTGIDAVPGSMGAGTMWTETDLRQGAWYLDPAGRGSPGVTVETGQADLLLISWLGADLLDGTDGRVYRLLGFELTYHGSLPVPGETLRFEIRIDGHAEHGGTRLFSFEYDGYVGDELRLTLRDGQAGYFSADQLSGTSGLLWDPAEHAPDPAASLAPPALPAAASRRGFGREQVRALSEGRADDCFGPQWRATRSHVRTPRLVDGPLLLLEEVPEVDPTGGPWNRGYLRAETTIHPDDWYFPCHFLNDPCMAGTLLLEGCFQAMEFYLAAMGFTVDRDGWRFEPEHGAPLRIACRGQVTPETRKLTYEVFVRELSDDGEPTLVADVLCTADGVKGYLASGVRLRLVRDWPLEHWRHLGPPAHQRTGELVAPASLGGLAGYRETPGVAFGYRELLALAWGRAAEGLPPVYGPADDVRRVPRMPGPPYHFMSRVVSVDGPPGAGKAGVAVVAEYDVPSDSWFFEQNDGVMPAGVLMEIALQPCGWLASHAGCTLMSAGDLLFRNLDGTATLDGVVGRETTVVRTRAVLREISPLGDTIIVSFDIECTADDIPVLRASTVFGFFPPEAFEDQAGLPWTDAEAAALGAPSDPPPALRTRTAAGHGGPRLAGPMLLMLDRLTGFWPDGGASGLGRLLAEKDVDPGEWFFRCHFFRDPVQPGSLGVEAMYQLLQTYLIETGAADGLSCPRFEPAIPGRPIAWRYRGQVVPANERVVVELEVREAGADDRGRYAVAEAWLWVDGKRIYHVRDLGMRVVEAGAGETGRGR